MKRRHFFKLAGIGITAILTTPVMTSQIKSTSNNFEGHILDKLPYSLNALEPYLDARTIDLHYNKHHKGYFKRFTEAIQGSKLVNTPIDLIFKDIHNYNSSIRNNGGGYYNHSLYWQSMSPNGGNVSDELKNIINKDIGSMETFKDSFYEHAKNQFGSGWTWLILNEKGKLEIGNTSNQDNPLMSDSTLKGIPLLTLDVWEHAYYLKYQNMRSNYIKAFENIINWEGVNERYSNALKQI